MSRSRTIKQIADIFEVFCPGWDDTRNGDSVARAQVLAIQTLETSGALTAEDLLALLIAYEEMVVVSPSTNSAKIRPARRTRR